MLKEGRGGDFDKLSDSDSFKDLLINSSYKVPTIMYMAALTPAETEKFIEKVLNLVPEDKEKVMNGLQKLIAQKAQFEIVKSHREGMSVGVVKGMHLAGADTAFICKATGLSEPEVKKILESK